ncbi:MAG: DUF2203 domain-containing protein [Candidatus Thermoplasmatota archaeon]|nr:DUF2203 domain-containing protein [Candidatus Thermoplasmatota archaeon]
MPTQPYFDLNTARATLAWLKPQLRKLKELGEKGGKAMAEFDVESADAYTLRIHKILSRINKKGIDIRDQEATLVDFPAVINNMPAFFCWQNGEEDIEYWHYAEDGFAGRTRITGTEQILSYL